MRLIDAYRNAHPDDPRSDDEILNLYEKTFGTERLAQAGFEEFAKPEQTPPQSPSPDWEALERYNRIADASLIGELGRGLETGYYGLKASLGSTGAMIGRVLEEPELEKGGMATYHQAVQDMAQIEPPAVGKITEVGGPREFGLWAARKTGELAPIMAGGVALSAAGKVAGTGLGALALGTKSPHIGEVAVATALLPDLLYNLALTQNYAELIDSGADPVSALKAQVYNLPAAALFSIMQIRAATKAMANLKQSLPPGTPPPPTAIKAITEQAIKSGPTHLLLGESGMLVSEAGRMLAESYATNKIPSHEEIWNRLVDAAAAGGLIGAGMTAFEAGSAGIGRAMRPAEKPGPLPEEIKPKEILYEQPEKPGTQAITEPPQAFTPVPGETATKGKPITAPDEARLAAIARKRATGLNLTPDEQQIVENLSGEHLQKFNEYLEVFGAPGTGKESKAYAVQKQGPDVVHEEEPSVPVQEVDKEIRPVQGIEETTPPQEVTTLPQEVTTPAEEVPRVVPAEKAQVQVTGREEKLQDTDTQIKELTVARYNDAQIAERLGVTPEEIVKRKKAIGVPTDTANSDELENWTNKYVNTERPQLVKSGQVKYAINIDWTGAEPTIKVDLPPPTPKKPISEQHAAVVNLQKTKYPDAKYIGGPARQWQFPGRALNDLIEHPAFKEWVKPFEGDIAAVEELTSPGLPPKGPSITPEGVKLQVPPEERKGLILNSAADRWARNVLKGEGGKLMAVEPVTYSIRYSTALLVRGAALIEQGFIKFTDWLRQILMEERDVEHISDAEIEKAQANPYYKELYEQSIIFARDTIAQRSLMKELAEMFGMDKDEVRTGAVADKIDDAVRTAVAELTARLEKLDLSSASKKEINSAIARTIRSLSARWPKLPIADAINAAAEKYIELKKLKSKEEILEQARQQFAKKTAEAQPENAGRYVKYQLGPKDLESILAEARGATYGYIANIMRQKWVMFVAASRANNIVRRYITDEAYSKLVRGDRTLEEVLAPLGAYDAEQVRKAIAQEVLKIAKELDREIKTERALRKRAAQEKGKEQTSVITDEDISTVAHDVSVISETPEGLRTWYKIQSGDDLYDVETLHGFILRVKRHVKGKKWEQLSPEAARLLAERFIKLLNPRPPVEYPKSGFEVSINAAIALHDQWRQKPVKEIHRRAKELGIETQYRREDVINELLTYIDQRKLSKMSKSEVVDYYHQIGGTEAPWLVDPTLKRNKEDYIKFILRLLNTSFENYSYDDLVKKYEELTAGDREYPVLDLRFRAPEKIAREIAAKEWYINEVVNDYSKMTLKELLSPDTTLPPESLDQKPVPVISLVKKGENVSHSQLIDRIRKYVTDHEPVGAFISGRIAIEWNRPDMIEAILERYIGEEKMRSLTSRGSAGAKMLSKLRQLVRKQVAQEDVTDAELLSVCNEVIKLINLARFRKRRIQTIEDDWSKKLQRETIAPDEIDPGQKVVSVFDSDGIISFDGKNVKSEFPQYTREGGEYTITEGERYNGYLIETDPKTNEHYLIAVESKTGENKPYREFLFGGQEITTPTAKIKAKDVKKYLETRPYHIVTLMRLKAPDGQQTWLKAKIYQIPSRSAISDPPLEESMNGICYKLVSGWQLDKGFSLRGKNASRRLVIGVDAYGNTRMMVGTMNASGGRSEPFIGGRIAARAMRRVIPIKSFGLADPITDFISGENVTEKYHNYGTWEKYENWEKEALAKLSDAEDRKALQGRLSKRGVVVREEDTPDIETQQLVRVLEMLGDADEEKPPAQTAEEMEAIENSANFLKTYDTALSMAAVNVENQVLIDIAEDTALDLWGKVSEAVRKKLAGGESMQNALNSLNKNYADIVSDIFNIKTNPVGTREIMRRILQDFMAGKLKFDGKNFVDADKWPKGQEEWRLPRKIIVLPQNAEEAERQMKQQETISGMFGAEVAKRLAMIADEVQRRYGKNVFDAHPTAEIQQLVGQRIRDLLLPTESSVSQAKTAGKSGKTGAGTEMAAEAVDISKYVESEQPPGTREPIKPVKKKVEVADKPTPKYETPKLVSAEPVVGDTNAFFDELKKFIENATDKKGSSFGTDWIATPDQVLNKFRRAINTLAEKGLRIDLFRDELPEEWKRGLPDGTKGVAIPSLRAIGLAMEDFTAPTPADYVRLLHEAVHHVFDDLPADVIASIHEAIDDIGDIAHGIKDEKAIWRTGTPDDAGERLIQAVAERLATAGYDITAAKGWAERIWMWVKDVAARLIMAVQRAAGMAPNFEQAVEYLKLRTERFLAGNHDVPDLFSELAIHSPEAKVDHLVFFSKESFPRLDIETGQYTWPDARIDSSETASYLWAKEIEQAPDKYPSVTVMKGAPPAETEAAKLKAEQISAALKHAAEQLGYVAKDAGLTMDEMVRLFNMSDPREILDDIIKKHSTQPPNLQPNWNQTVNTLPGQAARDYANLHSLGILWSARNRISDAMAKVATTAKNGPLRLAKMIQSLNVITKDYQDTRNLTRVIRQEMEDLVREFATFATEAIETGTAKGELTRELKDLEGAGWSGKVARQYEKIVNEAWDKLSKSGTLFDIYDALRQVGADMSNLSGKSVREYAERMMNGSARDIFRDLAETGPTGKPTAHAKSLCALVAAFAKRHSIVLDILEHRAAQATQEKLLVNQAIADIMKGVRDDQSAAIKKLNQLAAKSEYVGRLLARLREAKRDADDYAKVVDEAVKTVATGEQAIDSLNRRIAAMEHAMKLAMPVEIYEGAPIPYIEDPVKSTDQDVLRANRLRWSEDKDPGDLITTYKTWLAAHPTKTGRVYEWVKRTHDKIIEHLAYDLDVVSKPGKFGWLLSSLPARLKLTGKAEANEIADRIYKFNQFEKGYAYQALKEGGQVSKALAELKETSGLSYQDVHDLIVQPVLRWARSNFRLYDGVPMHVIRQKLAAYLASNPATAAYAKGPVFEKLMVFFEKNGEANAWAKKISKEMGLEVLDEQTGETILRAPIGDSRLVFPATVSKHAKAVYSRLSHAWGTSKTLLTSKTVTENLNLDRNAEIKRLQSLFDPATMRDLVYPLLVEKSMEGEFPLFSIPGSERRIHVQDAINAWKKYPNDIVELANELYRLCAQRYPTEVKGTADEYLGQFVGTIWAQWRRLAKTMNRMYRPTAFGEPPPGAPHQLMDARVADSLPSRFSDMLIYDHISSKFIVNKLAFHAAFGRDGNVAIGLFNRLARRVSREADYWSYCLKKANGNPEEAAKLASADPMAPAAPELLESSWAMRDKVEDLPKTFVDWVSGRNGMHRDWTALMDVVRTVASLVIQSPKTSLTNFYSMFAPWVTWGVSAKTTKLVLYNWEETIKNFFGSVAEWLGMNVLQGDYYAKLRKECGYGTDTGLTMSEKLAAVRAATELQFMNMLESESGMSKRARMASRMLQALMQPRMKSKSIKPGEGIYPELGVPPFIFGFFNNIMHTGMIQGLMRMADIWMMDRVKYALDAFKAGKRPDWDKYIESQSRGNRVFESKFAAKLMDHGIRPDEHAEMLARQILSGTPPAEPFSRRQYMGIASIAQNDLILDSSITNRPPGFFSNPVLQMALPLWSWEFAWTAKLNEAFRTARGTTSVMKLRGKWLFAKDPVVIGLVSMMALAPITMVWSILNDLYDRLVVGKASARKTMFESPTITDFIESFVEASGTMATYGAYGDLANGIINFAKSGDTKGVSLDGRILLVRSLMGILNSMANMYNQGGAVSYATFWRPLANAVGGSAFLQYEDILLRMLSYAGFDDVIKEAPLVKEELAFVRRLSTENYLRVAGRLYNKEVTMPGGTFIPNATRPYIGDMVYAAMLDNADDFWDAWRGAVEAAKAEGHPDPVEYVRTAFASRNPIRRVFKNMPLESDLRKMLASLPPQASEEVRNALRLYNKYQSLVGAKPTWGSKEEKKPSHLPIQYQLQELRKRALLSSPRYGL